MSSATRLVLLFVSFVRFASSALWTRDCRVWRKGRRVCPRQTCRTERERRRKSVSVVSLGCFSRLFSYNLCTKRKKNLQIYVGKKAPNERAKNVGTTMVSVMQSYHLVSYNLRVLYVSSFFYPHHVNIIIVTLKLPRTILLLLLPDRVFILLRPRATRVPAFGFTPIAVI